MRHLHRLYPMLLALASCQGSPGARDATETSHPKIVDGKDVDGAAYPTVSLQKLDSEGAMFSYCTGVLISPRHVLTAAHCSTEGSSTPVMAADAAARFVVAYDSQPERKEAQRVAVANIDLHPDYDPIKMRRNGQGLITPDAANDMAVWTLAAPAPQGPIADIMGTQEVPSYFVDRAQVILMGFGKRSSWDSPWIEHSLAMAETPYFATIEMTETKTVVTDGRPRKMSIKHQIPGKTATEFFAGGVHLPDTCKGDSGGPVFFKAENGRLLLVGITSRGAVSCDQGGVYSLVPAFIPWIRSTTGLPLTTVTQS